MCIARYADQTSHTLWDENRGHNNYLRYILISIFSRQSKGNDVNKKENIIVDKDARNRKIQQMFSNSFIHFIGILTCVLGDYKTKYNKNLESFQKLSISV